MTEEQKRKQWYVVHVLSGQEQKVHDSIVKRIKTEEMSDYIFEVILPTERVSEVKRGKKTETTRKFFPGYLIINMWLIDENKQLVGKSWYFIKETAGVLGFAGNSPPKITAPGTVTVTSGSSSNPIAVAVDDAESKSLTVHVFTTDDTRLPKRAITMGGTGTNRTLVLEPPAGQAGPVEVTIVANDGQLSAVTFLKVIIEAAR